jgi:peptide/nickel transport system substrate-binding protein
VSFRLVPESATRLATLETGEIQLSEEITPIEVDRLQKDIRFQIVRGVYPGGPAQVQMNTSRPPLDELPVRQAIQLAVNQADLTKVIFQGAYTPVYTPTSPGTFGYDESLGTAYKTNPARSQELLEQAGWKAGADGIRAKDGKPLEVTVNVVSEITDTVRAAELIQAQLREVGIKMNIQQLDTAAWNAAVAQGSQQAVIGWRGASDPDFLRPIFHSANIGKSPLQRTFFKDERLDQLLTQGSQEQDRDKRAQQYREAQEIILKQALIVPLWNRYNFVGARSSVRELSVDPRGYPRLYDVWLAR